ncbi:MAG: hypothetical protein ACRD96_13990, partial [Bryobacteraceae bacterium]
MSALLVLLALLGAEPDAVAISENIQRRHLPFGTILDPRFRAPDSDEIEGYNRCGDSAIWTGHYLAAEAYRWRVTRSPAALDNARRALAGLRLLVDVTGTGVLARCVVPANSPFAEGLLSEEAHHGHTLNGGLYWVGNTSRDQYSGVFFGLAAAFEMIEDNAVRTEARDLATRMLDFLLDHNWAVVMPDGQPSTVFWGRADQQLALLQIGRRLNPGRFGSTYRWFAFFNAAGTIPPVSLEVLDKHHSYFKFNLDSINLFHLIRYEDSSFYRSFYNKAYEILRNTTDGHGNAHFNMLDRGVRGANAARDEETVRLLAEWLTRPRRDPYVDLRAEFAACGEDDRACDVIPVPRRVTTGFLWERSPFQLYGGGEGRIEGAGIDYILPY